MKVMILLKMREFWLDHEYKVMVPLLAYIGKLGMVRPLLRYIENVQIRVTVFRLETIAIEKHNSIFFGKVRLREDNFYYFPIYFSSSEKLSKMVAKQFEKETGVECLANKNEIMMTKASFWKGRMGGGEYYM